MGIQDKECSSCGRELELSDEQALTGYVIENLDVPTGLQMLNPRNWGSRSDRAEELLESMDEIQCWGCLIEDSA